MQQVELVLRLRRCMWKETDRNAVEGRGGRKAGGRRDEKEVQINGSSWSG